ncbi:MAG: hypothetical protein FWE87_02090 [Coriobacteriia bacterium]|nr:hypothetical protein [Coriobacteriia bacterium]
MSEKIKKGLRYLLYVCYSNLLYGTVVYLAFTWISRYSLLLGYMGNLFLIVLGLYWDDSNLKMLESKKTIERLKTSDDVERDFRILKVLFFDAFVSFKTALYLFYILIMVVSQVIEFYPDLFNHNLTEFIFANRYSILLLIAIDQIIIQLSQDKKRISKISESMRKELLEG